MGALSAFWTGRRGAALIGGAAVVLVLALSGAMTMALLAPELLLEAHTLEDVTQAVIWAALAVVIARSSGPTRLPPLILVVAASAAVALVATAGTRVAPAVGADPGLGYWIGGWAWIPATTLPLSVIPLVLLGGATRSPVRRGAHIAGWAGCGIAVLAGMATAAGAGGAGAAVQVTGFALVALSAVCALVLLGAASRNPSGRRRFLPVLGAMALTVPALVLSLLFPAASPLIQVLVGPLIPIAIAATVLGDLIEDLHASRERVLVARGEERERISRDLHDDLGPLLSAVGVLADTASLRLRSGGPDTIDLVDRLRSVADEAIHTVRRVLADLTPTGLQQHTLEEAVRRLADALVAAGIRVEITSSAGDEVPERAATAAYRIVAEALNNAVRHARPTTVTVDLSRRDGHLRVCVGDDGLGIDPARSHVGRGLLSMAERARSLGGSLSVESVRAGTGVDDGSGTRVIADLPLRLQEAGA